MPFKRNLVRHHQFMLICLEYHPEQIRQSTAYKRLGKDRKYFQDIIPELITARLLFRQNKYYFNIPANIVRKVSGGVRNPFINSLEGVSLDDKFLTLPSAHEIHAFTMTYFHDYPEHFWDKLRSHGTWEAEKHPNLKRFVFDPTYSYFEDSQYEVKMYKKTIVVYGPTFSTKKPEDRGYRYLATEKVGRFIQWFVGKRLNVGKLKVRVEPAKPPNFHEPNRIDPFQEIANKCYEEGLLPVYGQDYTIDASKEMPEFEGVQGYIQQGFTKPGIGPDLVDEVLYFPRIMMNHVVPRQTQLVGSIQKHLEEWKEEQESVNVELVKSLKLINSGLAETNDSLGKNNRSMENIAVFLDNLATKEDLEIVKEHIQKLNYTLERQTEKRFLINLDTKCQKILNKLAEGSLTRTELALFLGVSDTAPLTQLRKLIAVRLVEEESILTGKRGRPAKRYKLLNKE